MSETTVITEAKLQYVSIDCVDLSANKKIFIHDPKDCALCRQWGVDRDECYHNVGVSADGKCHSCECMIIWAAGVNATLKRIARDVEKRP